MVSNIQVIPGHTSAIVGVVVGLEVKFLFGFPEMDEVDDPRSFKM
jgi:hypothetical protein